MRTLIVEDEPLLAMLLEDILIDEGHDVVGIAQTQASCDQILGHTDPQFAFVDVRLADGPTGPAIAADLVKRHIAVVFLTGSPDLVPEGMVGAIGVMRKPYADSQMRNVISFLSAALTKGVTPPPPDVLKLAPGSVPDRDGQMRFPMAA